MGEQQVSSGRASGDLASEYVRRWYAAGLITDDQRQSILEFELQSDGRPVQRLTPVAEIATYLGGVIAFAAGAAVVAPNWSRLGLGGQVVLALAIAAVGFVVGRSFVRFGESGTNRVGWFLWAVATGGMALAAGAVVDELDPRDGAWIPFTIGIVVASVSGALWRNLDRPIQLATTGVGVLLTLVGAAELVDADTVVLAPAVWISSAAVGAVSAIGWMRPRIEALVASALGLMIGSFIFMDVSERFAAVLAVVTAAGIVGFAMFDRSMALIAVGVLAFFVATTSLMQIVLHGVVQRLIAALAGLLVVALVGLRAQRLGRPSVR